MSYKLVFNHPLLVIRLDDQEALLACRTKATRQIIAASEHSPFHTKGPTSRCSFCDRYHMSSPGLTRNRPRNICSFLLAVSRCRKFLFHIHWRFVGSAPLGILSCCTAPPITDFIEELNAVKLRNEMWHPPYRFEGQGLYPSTPPRWRTSEPGHGHRVVVEHSIRPFLNEETALVKQPLLGGGGLPTSVQAPESSSCHLAVVRQ
ncbi:hypothetical protein F4802DRAFT_81038 [Xylaria palmicola]|nr:hypothetical protein F4802DRAFT_81038 [Xylaria palmicola]